MAYRCTIGAYRFGLSTASAEVNRFRCCSIQVTHCCCQICNILYALCCGDDETFVEHFY